MTLVDGTLLVSNSEVQTFKHCRRRWFLGYYLSLGPKVENMVGALPTGSRVHEALEGWYVPDGQPRRPIIEALHEAHARDYGLILADAGENLVDPDLMTKFEKSKKLEIAMLSGYADWLEDTGADSEIEVIASEESVEVPFEVEGVSVPVKLLAKLDVQARHVYSGKLMFLDHKTAADFGKVEAKVSREEQVLHYMLIQRLAHPDSVHATGAIYNLLRKVLRTGQAKPPFYQRLLISHNPHELDAYQRRLSATIRDLWRVHQQLDAGQSHLDAGAYPTPGDQCEWRCEFNRACTLLDDGSRWLDLLNDTMVARDPLARYAADNSTKDTE